METVSDKLVVFATTYGLKIVGAIIILIVGRIAASIARRAVKRMLVKQDPSVVSFAGSFAYILVLVFAILAALAKFGFQTASLVAVLGAAGLAIGFALPGSLANFAAGIHILVFPPFRVGDFIDVAGVAGTVKEIELFMTELATPDNVRILVPNGKIYGDIIKNFSANDTRRVDLVIGIGYDSPVQKAMDLLMTIIKEDNRVLSEPAPQIAVSELADSSVNLVVRPWVKKDDYWDLRFDLTQKIKESFDQNGIEIPFPQRVVHMVSENQ
jgi:small conductance mechanosensitive channel